MNRDQLSLDHLHTASISIQALRANIMDLLTSSSRPPTTLAILDLDSSQGQGSSSLAELSNQDDYEDGDARIGDNLKAKAKEKVKTQKRRVKVEYTRLSLQFESALIQHKLALQYYDFRSFYFVFLPVTLIATLITIIGFLISGIPKDDDVDDGTAQGSTNDIDPLLTGDSKQIWSLVVGILGAIATLVNSIGKRANYQSQSDMHRSAVKALEKICLTVDFEQEWFDRNRKVQTIVDYSDSAKNNKKKLVETLGADLKTHQASFKAMLDACCDSPVPDQVAQAFTLMEQLFRMELYMKPDIDKDTEIGFFDLPPLKSLIFHYHKLWKEYSTYPFWPLKAPSIKVSEKYNLWKEETKAIYVHDVPDVEEADVPDVEEAAANSNAANNEGEGEAAANNNWRWRTVLDILGWMSF